jgi:hypothetical protein
MEPASPLSRVASRSILEGPWRGEFEEFGEGPGVGFASPAGDPAQPARINSSRQPRDAAVFGNDAVKKGRLGLELIHCLCLCFSFMSFL